MSKASKGFLIFIVIVAAIAIVTPVPHHRYRQRYQDDLIASASEYGHSSKGGDVKIKVYRGPSKGYGYHKFAPWGMQVYLPEDDHKKYGYGHH